MLGNIHGIARPWFVCTWFPIMISSRGCSVSQIRFQVFLVFYFLLNQMVFFSPGTQRTSTSYALAAWHIHGSRAPCLVTCTPAWHAAQRCTKEGSPQSSGGIVPKQNIWVASTTLLPLFILDVMKNKHLESLAYSTDQKSWFWGGPPLLQHYLFMRTALSSAPNRTEMRLALPPGLKNWGDRSDEGEWYMSLRQYSLCCQLPEGSLWVQRIFWRINTH